MSTRNGVCEVWGEGGVCGKWWVGGMGETHCVHCMKRGIHAWLHRQASAIMRANEHFVV